MASEFLPDFTHFPVRTEISLLIQTVCTKCGASRVVSVADGSLKSGKRNIPARAPISKTTAS